MMNSSAGSPEADRWSADGFLAGNPDAERAGGTGSACCDFNQCNPTATPCAQILPHSRASRQLQRFSISMLLLMTIEARKEASPDCTTPRSNGASQQELSTWPCAR